jgi:hypothetical protein
VDIQVAEILPPDIVSAAIWRALVWSAEALEADGETLLGAC